MADLITKAQQYGSGWTGLWELARVWFWCLLGRE